MAETTYVSVVWTSGDIVTEAKMDNMVANDRAVDAMAQGVEFIERADPSTPGTNKIHVFVKDKGGIPTIYAINDAGTIYELSESTPTYMFPIQSVLYVTALATSPLTVIKDSEITRAHVYVGTPPTDADLIFDINLNGTSIWNSTPANRLKIVDGNNAGSQTSFDTVQLLVDDVLTLDIDQVGSTIAGADAIVSLKTK